MFCVCSFSDRCFCEGPPVTRSFSDELFCYVMVPLLWILHDGSFLRAVMWLRLFVMGYYVMGHFRDGLIFYGS